MSTNLSKVGGFTPIIDVLVEEYGLVTASVFGRVWRYCQGERGVCYAKLDTIGKGLKTSGKTIHRHLQKLCKEGYLEDMTPGLKNRPHTYRDTGKVMLTVQFTVTESQSDEDSTMTENPSQMDRESVPDRQRVNSRQTESPSQIDRESVEDTTQDTTKETIKKQVKRRTALPSQAQVFIDNGGRFRSGQLKKGETKKARAIALMVDKIPDTPADLALWARIVDGYCAQWSSYSYTTMVNDYFLEGRVPGDRRNNRPKSTADDAINQFLKESADGQR